MKIKKPQARPIVKRFKLQATTAGRAIKITRVDRRSRKTLNNRSERRSRSMRTRRPTR